MHTKSGVALCLVLHAVSAGAQDLGAELADCTALREEFNQVPVVAMTRPDDTCRLVDGCLQVDWSVATDQDLTAALALMRVTDETQLRVHTTNVNTIHFQVSWSTTVVRTNEAFELVSSWFDQVFPILSLLPTGETRLQDSTDSWRRWLRGIELTDHCASAVVGGFSASTIDLPGSRANRDRLAYIVGLFEVARQQLGQRRREVLEDGPDYADYYRVAERHASVEKRVAELMPRMRTAVVGTTYVVEAAPRNSEARLAGQLRNLAGQPVGDDVAARFFVATHRPLYYHVGVGYGGLRSVKFREIQLASGQTVFAPESEDGASDGPASAPAYAALMTWEFLAFGPNARYGLGLTLGTNLRRPGQDLLLGVTARVFSRLLLSGGMAATLAEAGVDALDDPLPSGTSRTVFAAIKHRTATRPFLAVSFKVY